MKADSSLSALMCWALYADAPFCGIGANIREVKATAHHARSSLRHGHQLDDMPVVVLVIEAAATIPIVELSVSKAPGPLPKAKPASLTRCRIASNSASLT